MTAPAEEVTDETADELETAPEGDAEAPAEKDWQAEFNAQKRINRDIERRSKQRMRELETELAEARKGPKEPAEVPDPEVIRAEIRTELQHSSLRERALDKLEAKAARLFQNPEDARAFLAANVDDFIDGDKLDLQAITDALGDLLTQRPYLGVTQGDGKRFQGTADSGPKGNPGKPQLTEAEVMRLAAEGRNDEIEAARVEGRLNTYLGIT